MTKQELIETYTAEQLAEMVEILYNENTDLKEELLKKTGLCGEAKVSLELNGTECSCGGYNIAIKKNKELQSEVEKYRKAFENTKKWRDCQIAEHQKKIDELEKKSDFYFPEEPIKVADLMIHGWETSWNYKNFSISELRQIAEHLLVYCNHNGEV